MLLIHASSKERPQKEKNEIHICKSNEISLLTSYPTFSVDHNNGEQFQKLSSDDQYLLEGESREDYNCLHLVQQFQPPNQ